MTWYAQYDPETGFIQSTSDREQPLKEGLAQMALPDGMEWANGGSHQIDVQNGQLVALPPPEPIPDPMAQLIAALISKGVVSADDFHPKTIDAINANLAAGNMTATQIAVAKPAIVS